VYKFTT